LSIESTVFSQKVPQRVARNTAVNILGRATGMVATLALNISIARVLGDSAFGLYMSVWALLMIVNVIAHMGTETIVVHESSRDLERSKELVSNALTIRLVLGLLAYAAAIVVAVLMREGHAFVGYVAIAGLSFFVWGHSLIATYFDATLRIGTRTLLVTGCLVLTLALTVIVLFLKLGLGAVLLVAVLANAVTLVVTYFLVPRHFRPTLGRNLAVMKNMLSASWPLAGNMFHLLVAGHLGLLMLLKMKGEASAGGYGAALSMTTPLGVIPQAFMLSVFPLMSFYHSRNPVRFGDIYRQSLKYMSVIAMPFALLVSFYSEPILKVFYGGEFVSAAPALAIRAWFLFFIFIGNVNFGAIVVENRQKAALAVDVSMLVPSVVLYFLLIGRYGIVGAALGELLRQLVFYVALLIVPSTRKYSVTSAAASFRPILAACCAGALLYWMRTPVTAVLALVLYGLILWLARVIGEEDLELLFKVFRRTGRVRPTPSLQRPACFDDPSPDFERRTRQTLFCREPDRVPLLEIGADRPVKEAFLGRPIRNLRDELDFWRKAGYDCVPVPLDIPAGAKQLVQRGKLREGKTVSAYTYAERHRSWIETSGNMVTSWQEFEAFPWETPDDVDFSQLDELASILKDEGMKAIGVFGGVLDSTIWTMGYETFCYKLADDPKLVEAIEQRFGEFVYGVLKSSADYDCVGALWYVDDLAYTGGLRVNPAHLRRNVFPWMKKIGGLCRELNVPYLYHTDGDVTEVLDDIIGSGVNALHPIEPKCMDIADLKRTVGDRLCLIGNIDLGSTLTLGTPENVDEEVKSRIRECAPGGGYCVGSSNSVTDYVPIENYVAMLNATFKYGAYPLEL
jgi:uroporphyrinogen decarboxylase